MTSDSSRDRTDDSRSSSEGDEPASGRGRRRRSVLQTVGVGVVGATLGASGLAVGRQRDAVAAGASIQASQLWKLTASDAEAGDYFGHVMSVSADETTAIVGAHQEDHAGYSSGAAYVYDLTQDPPTETKLTASDAERLSSYGDAVSLNADGTTAIVGARLDDERGYNAGAAYVYDLSQNPPTETKLIPSDVEENDYFGNAVSLSGDGTTAIVGATLDDDAGDGSGATYVYDLTQQPSTEIKLTPSDDDAMDYFGRAVSLSGDGTTAIVGGHVEDGRCVNLGSAYVYDLTQQPPTGTKLAPGEAAASEVFVDSVSMDGDGTTAIVGTQFYDEHGRVGAAYVYDLSQNHPTRTELTPHNDDGRGSFGEVVSLSADGTTALVGESYDDSAGIGSGAAYVYDLAQQSPTGTEFTANDVEEGDYFGNAVSLSEEGTTALVGASSEDDHCSESGAAYVFELTNS